LRSRIAARRGAAHGRTYRLDSGKCVVETRCAGEVTLDEVVEHFRALEADPALPPASTCCSTSTS
jgi:hypothetical protein